ncbi:MAG: DEAD/DEAH box helicase, partial [Prevotella sp.]|nr:DEAD/DEAH box helicase [Prevotella sp.]
MTDKYLDILREYWGYSDFRGIQRGIIESIGAGRDTLGLMPTGGGKSITFQVPALAMEGMCVVISPLIALMKDQVYHLTQHGIRSAAVYSGMSREEIIVTLE